jgi:polar amino acid transport system permease protein
MNTFPLTAIAWNLVLATRWTLALSAVAFTCGSVAGLGLTLLRVSHSRGAVESAKLYIDLFQGTPLLMQLFLVFFGIPLLGFDVSPWLAAVVGLTLYASAYLGEIWRGSVQAIPRGQWDAGASLGLRRLAQLRLVILPQALRIAIPPTVGFLVQLMKATAVASIIGFRELTRTGEIISNATFRAFTVYGLVALIYFILCSPLTAYARALERRLRIAR